MSDELKSDKQIQTVEYIFSKADINTAEVGRNLHLRFKPRWVKARPVFPPQADTRFAIVRCDFIEDENLITFSYSEPVNNTGSFRQMKRDVGQRVKFRFFEVNETDGSVSTTLANSPAGTDVLILSLTFTD